VADPVVQEPLQAAKALTAAKCARLHEGYRGGVGGVFVVRPDERREVRNDDAEDAAGLQVPEAIGERLVTILQRQMLEHVGAVKPATRTVGNWKPADDVTVPDAARKTARVACVEKPDRRALEPKRRAGVEIQPSLRRAEPAAILDVKAATHPLLVSGLRSVSSARRPSSHGPRRLRPDLDFP